MSSFSAQVTATLVDILREPDGPRERQLLFGDKVLVQTEKDGWSYIRAAKDGYVGFVATVHLGPYQQATHWISAPSTHFFAAPDLKSPDRMALGFGSLITVTSHDNGYAKTTNGYVPGVHITPIGTHMADPLDVAALFVGTPYLWGGNSRFGLDCSGLVQAAYLACGMPCPGDSRQQKDALGRVLETGTAPQRNDLLFWNGHVAMVYDADTILHANGHHLAVSYEPLRPALQRIEAQGEGKVICHLRPVLRSPSG